MIKRLEVENFQSHKHSVLEFEKGMNVIVGASDSGKTAIIRALRLSITNKPGGDEFRSNWGGDTRVHLTTSENEISRIKTNKLNQYWLDHTEFNAFGKDVPDEIKKALNMNSVNIQGQMDSPFLLSETSGNVAAHFNKVAKLDKIDRGLQNVQKQINSINQDIKSSEKEIEKKKEQLNDFVDLKAFEKALTKVEGLQEQEFESIRILNNLVILSADITNIQTQIKQKAKILLIEEAVDSLLSLIDQQKQVETNRKKLRKLSLEIYYLQQDIKKGEKVILAEVSVNKILNDYDTLKETTQKSIQIGKVYTNITENIKGQEIALKSISKLSKEFRDNFPDVCFLCGSEIHDHGTD